MARKQKKLYRINVYDIYGNIIDYFKTDNNRKRERRIMAERFTDTVNGYKYKIFRLA